MTLEAHYPLTEDVGNVALDYSGNENHGSVTGAGPDGTGTVTGPFGNSAYDFDGTDDYVDTPIGLSNYGNTCITLWVKTTSSGQFISSQGGDQVFIGDASAGYENNGTFYSSSWSVNFNDGNWHHLILQNDDQNFGMWLDGTLNASGAYNGGVTNLPNLVVGAFNNNGIIDSNIDGQIADVRIYSRALSPQEVQALYQAGERSEAVFGVTDSTAAAQSVSGGGGGGSTGGGGGGTTY